MSNNKSKPTSVIILLILILFQGLSGLFGGVGLVLDPSGKSLQIPISWLENSPFNDYFIPGLILLIILGALPIITLYGLWYKLKWGWLFAQVLGLALIIWIGVEILIIGYQPKPPLQLIYGLVGLMILIFVFLPSVKRYYKNTNDN
jgi:CDP-diglyceride synthetase